ncbi:hypothetical protein chiPu_0026502 [Chiloscyllium punctatum]|uniref:Uncharacterized protein n=1 Tax=Chiloscyllium punctatum TaxID=137246 RepID=A0A401TJN2_CHIPU|nr:hypothetical protein [Chiloscyllium punctatum]
MRVKCRWEKLSSFSQRCAHLPCWLSLCAEAALSPCLPSPGACTLSRKSPVPRGRGARTGAYLEPGTALTVCHGVWAKEEPAAGAPRVSQPRSAPLTSPAAESFRETKTKAPDLEPREGHFLRERH